MFNSITSWLKKCRGDKIKSGLKKQLATIEKKDTIELQKEDTIKLSMVKQRALSKGLS